MWNSQWICFHYGIATLPCIAFLLAPLGEQIVQTLLHLKWKSVQASAIISDSIVMVLSNKYLIYLLHDIFYLHMSHLPYLPVYWRTWPKRGVSMEKIRI